MSKKKILLVDDEPQFVDLVKMRLEANDYEKGLSLLLILVDKLDPISFIP